MSDDRDKSEQRVACEPPQLMRLAAPNAGAAFCQTGSGNQPTCNPGSSANACSAGYDADSDCVAGGANA